ncbi:MAG TPA: ABC transporter substrate-binding protein [Kosmotogaceae bacterium]|nr:ABC transporter substrate-binding protein [Kosmotogaceae bacterium]
MKRITVLLTLAVFVLLSAMSFAQIELTVWYHDGQEFERAVIRDQIERFNASQDRIKITGVEIPEGTYTQQVNAAALAGRLPDILDLDGPTVANFAWGYYLHPLDEFMTEELIEDFLPSIIQQGLYHDNIWALGTFDSGLGFYANKSYLERVGARIPEGVEDAWTMDEFMEILYDLKELPEVTYPIDFKINYGVGEWFTYGFSPFWQAFGADLIDRESFMTAEGVLNGPEGIAAGEWFQGLFTEGLAHPNPPGDAEFVEGRAALSWVGHWAYVGYNEALGDDLVLVPPPIFPAGQAAGMGSWAWSITSVCEDPAAAWEFLEFILQPEEIVKMTNANGAVPSRFSAVELSEYYKEGGPLELFVEQLNTIAVERPVTPAYPTITSVFANAVDNIIKGGDVKAILDRAVRDIDRDIRDNDGYPFEW